MLANLSKSLEENFKSIFRFLEMRRSEFIVDLSSNFLSNGFLSINSISIFDVEVGVGKSDPKDSKYKYDF